MRTRNTGYELLQRKDITIQRANRNDIDC